MNAVLFDQRLGFCSPDCALAYLDDHDDVPDTVKLHDPQYNIDRGEVDVSEDSVDLIREVEGVGEVIEALSDMDDLYSFPWRVEVMDGE